MKKIIVIHSPFLFKHQVIEIGEESVVEAVLSISSSKLEETLVNYAYRNSISDIVIQGNKKFTSKIKENILKNELITFNKNTLNIKLV
jgi:hypothetical protein